MASRFVHTLLFACPECNLPVAISRISKEKNFEGVDAENLRIRCSYCEKVSDTTAVMARKHYVEEWLN
jgi:aspartate carbamoyltransferase regulatory subunit